MHKKRNTQGEKYKDKEMHTEGHRHTHIEKGMCTHHEIGSQPERCS